MWKIIVGMWVFGILMMILMEGLEMTFVFFFGIPPVYVIPGGLIVVSIYLLKKNKWFT